MVVLPSRAGLATSASTSRHPAPTGAQQCEQGADGPSVHLSHGRPLQDLSRQPQGLGEHPSVVLSRRQDRRAGRQRLRQIDAAAHHGRHRQGVHRRGLGVRGRARGLPATGAAARCDQDRARERDGGCRAAEGHPRSLQRTRRELLGRERGRDDQAAGRDRVQGAVGSRLQGRPGDGRPALPAG